VGSGVAPALLRDGATALLRADEQVFDEILEG
jgi:hypothetical protein